MKFLNIFSHHRTTKVKRRFSFVILRWMILISIVPICVLGYLWTVDRVNQFNKDADKIKADYYDVQTKLIQKQVDEVIHDIDFSHLIIHRYNSKLSLAEHTIIEDRLKHESLLRINKLRFGKEGYLFVNTADNKALIYNGQLLPVPIDILKSRKPEWIYDHIQRIKLLTDEKGKFFKYFFKKLTSNSKGYKIAYIRMYKPWGWYIGAGVYYDEINKAIDIEKAKLKESIKKDFMHIALIILIVIVILVIINNIINHAISQTIKEFKQVYSKAADDFTKVNLDKINYEEFLDLANSANKMIEERNHFFDALGQEHILLRSLIDAVPNLIFYKDKESRFLGCNQAFAAYMGFEENEIIGHTDIELLGTDRATAYHESDLLLLESNKVFFNEELIQYPDGSQVRYETIKTIFHDIHGNIQGIIGISHDITARSKMEEQLKIAKNKAEESNRLKTAFLANMSHEIRTPLNAILGFSNLLVYDEPSPEEQETYSRLIIQSGDSLANLVNDIVDMAKIESGQVDVEKNSLKVDVLMSDLLIMYRERINQLESAIIIKYDPDLRYPELTLNNDVTRIKQVIMNLLNNALKFSEKGALTFGFRVVEDRCNFFVRDQGIGIVAGNLEVIFDAFTQVDGTYSRQYGGVGLGLTISKQLVALMGGKIWVQSVSGEGSTFSFSLPLK